MGRPDARWVRLETSLRDRNEFNLDTGALFELTQALRNHSIGSRPDPIQFIQSEGVSVYLSAPYSLLRSRIGDKAAERPMFRDDIAAHELYNTRIRYYKMCDTTIDIRDDDTPMEIVERILLELPKKRARRTS